MSGYEKPVPVPSAATEFFWQGCKEHRLRLQRCDACGAFRFPPGPLCPECLSTDWHVADLSGRASLYTFGVYHRMYHPGFKADLPYVVGIIELEEGPRLLSNVIGCAPGDVRCGMPLKVVFEDVTEAVTLYKFAPAGTASGTATRV